MIEYTNGLLELRSGPDPFFEPDPLDPNASVPIVKVHHLAGAETLGEPFEYEIGIFGQDVFAGAPSRQGVIDQILGEQICIEFPTGEQGDYGEQQSTPLPTSRYICGHVQSFEVSDERTGAGDFVYHLAVRCWLDFLSRRVNCRIFENTTALTVLNRLFAEHVPASRWDVIDLDPATFESRPYCVQYNESDLEFAQRLIREEGLYYSFEHRYDAATGACDDVLVFADAPADHRSFSQPRGVASQHFRGTYADLEYNRQAREDEEKIRKWVERDRAGTTRYRSRDYFFESTAHHHQARGAALTGPTGLAERYEYPGRFRPSRDASGLPVEDQAVRTAFSDMRSESLDADARRWSGLTDARGMAPGRTYEVIGADPSPMNVMVTGTSYVVQMGRSELVRKFRRPAIPGGPTNEGQLFEVVSEFVPEPGNNTHWIHRCEFEAIEATKQYRSPRLPRRAHVRGPQTAIVVDDTGSDAGTGPAPMDDLGRVRVRLHWSATDGFDPNNPSAPLPARPTCRLRIAQPSASGGWGSWFAPHIGDEVVVSFLDGDPDRPLITGRVYNASRPPQTAMPNEPTSNLRAQLADYNDPRPRDNDMTFISDHGGNHLVMNGKAGYQQILLHANNAGKKHDSNGALESNYTGVSEIWVGANRQLDIDAEWPDSQDWHVKGGIGMYTDGDYTVSVVGDKHERIEGDTYKKTIGVTWENMIGLKGELKAGASIQLVFLFDISYLLGVKLGLTHAIQISQTHGRQFMIDLSDIYQVGYGDNDSTVIGTQEIYAGKRAVVAGWAPKQMKKWKTVNKKLHHAKWLVTPFVTPLWDWWRTWRPKDFDSVLVLDENGASLMSQVDDMHDSDFFDTNNHTTLKVPRVTVSNKDGSVTVIDKSGKQMIKVTDKAIEITSGANVKVIGKKVTLSASTIEMKGTIKHNSVTVSSPPPPPPPPPKVKPAVPQVKVPAPQPGGPVDKAKSALAAKGIV